MDILDREALIELAGHHEWPAVSVYLPTHRAGSETQQDPIRMKNLLKQAEASLIEGGMRSPDAEALLAETWRLQSDPGFWREGSEGLALFVSPDTSKVFRTTSTMPERLRVGEHFLIRPLLPALAPPLRFMVLALSKNRIRLLEGSTDDIREMDPEGIPQGLAEALKYDDYETQVHFHSRTPAAAGGAGRRAAVFHGHGGHADTAKDSLERYFRLVDKALNELVGGSTMPLMLAGVDYLLPIYHSVSSYPDLLPEALTGNPDETPAAVLHAEALRLLEPHFRRTLEADLTALDEARQSSVATDAIEDIVLAAHAGRVETLFVNDSHEVWGNLELDSVEVTSRDRREPGDADLLDRAAAQTLLHGGAVHVMGTEEVHAAIGTKAAAVLRY